MTCRFFTPAFQVLQGQSLTDSLGGLRRCHRRSLPVQAQVRQDQVNLFFEAFDVGHLFSRITSPFNRKA